MKMFMCLLYMMFLVGCEEEGAGSLVVPEATSETEIISAVGEINGHEDFLVEEESEAFAESLDEDLEVVKVEPENPNELVYTYDEKTGECLNEDDDTLGVNEAKNIECSDATDSLVLNFDLENTKPYAMDISGSTIVSVNKVRAKDLFKYEVLFDANTIFENRRNFLEKVLKNFSKREVNLEKRKTKFEKRIETLEAKIVKTEEKIERKQANDKNIEKLLVRVQKLMDRVEVIEGKITRVEVKLEYLDTIFGRFDS